MVTTETRQARHMAEAEPENVPIDDARTAALVPEQLLQPGEIIILLLKPSPWYILLASLRSLTIILLLYLLAWSLREELLEWVGLRPGDLIVLALAAAGVRLFWQFLEWLSRVYILTDRRVVRIKGVIRVYVFEAPLKQIQHTTLYFSLRERFFALGTLGFTTAGTGMVEAYWIMVAKPLEVHQKVTQTLQRYR